jgi:hypothetical protein
VRLIMTSPANWSWPSRMRTTKDSPWDYKQKSLRQETTKKSLQTIIRVHETINKRVSSERPPKIVCGPS